MFSNIVRNICTQYLYANDFLKADT